MKESPILFNGDMVRAILDGRKTQTRRVITNVDGIGKVNELTPTITPNYGWDMRDKRGRLYELFHADLTDRCPLGMVKDRLYVRETFQALFKDGLDFGKCDYKTGEGYECRYMATEPATEFYDVYKNKSSCASIPSIHMPKWAARIWLDIIDVRVQRLQELTDTDALQEGIAGLDAYGNRPTSVMGQYPNAYRAEFGQLWASIYGQQSWDSNPWVWAITFKRVTP